MDGEGFNMEAGESCTVVMVCAFCRAGIVDSTGPMTVNAQAVLAPFL